MFAYTGRRGDSLIQFSRGLSIGEVPDARQGSLGEVRTGEEVPHVGTRHQTVQISVYFVEEGGVLSLLRLGDCPIGHSGWWATGETWHNGRVGPGRLKNNRIPP